jgi:diaminopimelate decarboxylase
LRINPDVDARTHPYISTGLRDNKFGIPFEEAIQVYQKAVTLAGLEVVGLDCHIGSQLTDTAPYVDALDRVLHLANALKGQGITLGHLDLGGGLGVRYQDETPPLPSEYVEALRSRLEGIDYEIIVEPGRAIAANAGVLLTRVEYLKDQSGRYFAIVDAAMNDLLRPALYGAWQAIVPVQEHSDAVVRTYDVVGPVCETGDFLGKERQLAITQGDLLAVRSAGAYGFTMSSNYNSRPRAAEVMVDGDQCHVVRSRERIEDLYQGESCLP